MPRGKSSTARGATREREFQIWALNARGTPVDQIAVKVGVSGSAVYKTLKRLTDRAIKEMDAEVQLTLVSQLAQLRQMYFEAIEAWEHSKQPAKQVVQNKVPAEIEGQPDVVTTTTVVRDRDGDPRLLQVALTILADMRKLLRLEETAPTILAVQNNFWMVEVKALLDSGQVTREDVYESVGPALADEFFKSQYSGHNGATPLAIEGEFKRT